MAKRIVVCCDGTWNDADSIDDLTNVSRLAWATKPFDDRDGKSIPQVVFYQNGVGSEGDIFDKIKGGGFGIGLAKNVRDAYTFICSNYQNGDEIFLFGFSRGAYTARSVGGLIGYAGLLGKRDLDRFMVLWDGYKAKPESQLRADTLKVFPDRIASVKIRCIGVWDTVGSLGIPGILGLPFQNEYRFHDTDLGAGVEVGLHALALDERREDFQPAVWKQKPDGKANGQVLKQVWFAGAHSDVGGGYPAHGLSDVSLAWMASEVEPMLALDFDYLTSRRDLSSEWGLSQLHDSAKGFPWEQRKKIPRKPFTADQATSFETLHPSVVERVTRAAQATPANYALLAGINAPSVAGKLSSRETALRWSAQDVRTAAQQPKQQPGRPGILDRLRNAFGLTA